MNHRLPADLNRLSGYTRTQVRTFLRPVAFCVVLLFGVGPAATLACELACSSPSGHGHHDAATHQHSSAVEDSASSTVDSPLLSTRPSNCNHDVVGSPALTSSARNVFAPIALDVLDTAAPDVRYTHISAIVSSNGSPPGVRSGPLPLRI